MQNQCKAVVVSVLMFSLLLSGCGPGQLFGSTITPSPTNTNTPTITPIPTATLTPTPTITFTPTAGVETMDRPLKITYTNLIENISINKVKVNGAIMIDETASQAGITKVIVPPDLGGEILYELAFRLYWHQGNIPHMEEPTKQDRIEFRDKWIMVQEGKLPCSEIQVKPFGFDAHVTGDKQQKMILELFCGSGEVSESARKIDSIEIVYVKGHAVWNGEAHLNRKDMPRFFVTNSDFGYGYETEVDGNILRFKVGLAWIHNGNPVNMAAKIGFLISWIRENNGEKRQNINELTSDFNFGKNLVPRGFSVRSK